MAYPWLCQGFAWALVREKGVVFTGFLLVCFGSSSRHVRKLSKLYRSIPEQVPNKLLKKTTLLLKNRYDR